jgi:hypothetical protein
MPNLWEKLAVLFQQLIIQGGLDIERAVSRKTSTTFHCEDVQMPFRFFLCGLINDAISSSN